MRFGRTARLGWACVSLFLFVGGQANGAPVHPTRPYQLPITTFRHIDYVSLADVATWLGMDRAWVERNRKMELFRAGVKMVFEVDSDQLKCNSLIDYLAHPPLLHRGNVYITKTDALALVAPLANTQVARAPGPVRVIALDAGHGGVDNGMQNLRLHLNEKDLALDVVFRLQALLKAQGYKVILTRRNDTFIELKDRPEIAERAGADLFLSVHFNAADPSVKGTEVYTYCPVGQSETRSHSDNSEKAPEPGNKNDFWNVVFASKLHAQLIGRLKTNDRGLKRAHWAVLKRSGCPAVLVESGFLTNDAEGRRASTPEFRQEIAQALAKGISNYTELFSSTHDDAPRAVSPASAAPSH